MGSFPETYMIQIYQNSNGGNRQKIEWNIKIINQTLKEGMNDKTNTKGGQRMDKRGEDWIGSYTIAIFENLLA